MLLRSGEELPWGTGEGTPSDGMLEFWAEILPGTSRDELDTELRGLVTAAAGAGVELTWEQRTRFLPATTIDPEAPVVVAMSSALGGAQVESRTAPFACDAFMFNEHSHDASRRLRPPRR